MIPKWMLKHRIAGRLDHLRETKDSYIADSYHLDVDWLVEFLPVVYKNNYSININGYSKYHDTCIEITLKKISETNSITFYTWLKQFRNENSDVGNLTREIINHKKYSFPYTTNYKETLQHFKFYYSNDKKILYTFEITFKKYKKSVLDKSKSTKNRGNTND